MEKQKMSPNQLRITVTDALGKEISAIVNLADIQNMANQHGEGALKDAIFGIFKQTVEKMKNGN